MLHIITVVGTKYSGGDTFQYVSVMRTSVETDTRQRDKIATYIDYLLYRFFVQNFLVSSHPEQIIKESPLTRDKREGEGENDQEMTPVRHLWSL